MGTNIPPIIKIYDKEPFLKISVRVCTDRVICSKTEITVRYEDTRLPPVFISPKNLIFEGSQKSQKIGIYTHEMKMSEKMLKVNQVVVY